MLNRARPAKIAGRHEGQLRETALAVLRDEHLDEVRAEPAAVLGARTLDTISHAAPPDRLLGYLDPEGHTILYGTGGIGKGTLATDWIGQLIRDGNRVLIVDYELHPTEWARRLRGLGYGDCADQVLHVAPSSPDWRGPRGALWSHSDELRLLVDSFGATFVVIDSIVAACGAAKSADPETPGLYSAALQQLGVPVLSLAHVVKTHDMSYPFGSVFWHNFARLTYSLEQVGDRVVLTCRKANNYARTPKMALEATFLHNVPAGVYLKALHETIADRIEQVLAGQTLTIKEIARNYNEQVLAEDPEAEVRTSDATIRKTISRNPHRFTKVGSDSWRVSGRDPEPVPALASTPAHEPARTDGTQPEFDWLDQYAEVVQ